MLESGLHHFDAVVDSIRDGGFAGSFSRYVKCIVRQSAIRDKIMTQRHKLSRRNVLRTIGAGAVVGSVMTGTASAQPGKDGNITSMRTDGSLPSTKVPSTQVTVAGEDVAEVPVGNWIEHQNGLGFYITHEDGDEWDSCAEIEDGVDGLDQESMVDPVLDFLDSTPQTFSIGGQELVLDSADDWEIIEHAECLEVPFPPYEIYATIEVVFHHAIPPQSTGTSYSYTWDRILEDGSEIFYEREIEVVNPGQGKSP